MSDKSIFVSISLNNKTMLAGRLWTNIRNGKESAAFEYDRGWLNNPQKFALEPSLKLIGGQAYTPEGFSLFGVIGDSAPDRWGRLLIRRSHKIWTDENKTAPRTLFEIDYLLGVSDIARQGALRFSYEPDGKYLKADEENSIPPLIKLPKLLSASENFLNSNETAQELKLLLAPGSSLGGARPKASVMDKDGSLCIAKFPKKDDESNAVLWEALALTLAKKAKINVPKWRVEKIANKFVLIIKRFDRNNTIRIPFLSAMSMLGAKDNETRSYLEIAYALIENGGAPYEDLKELFRRIIFNILISNTDDHLRNHGFLYESKKGWHLSPAYDINPVPHEIKAHRLSTNIDFNNNEASIETALSIYKEFRLSKDEALKIIKEAENAISFWRQSAKQLKISNKEIDYMSSAFEHEQTKIAKKLY